MIGALESANLKLIRISEHIKSIDQCLRSYARRKPHRIIKDAQGEEAAHIETSSILDDISLIAGEAVYQLRSALDHLAFDLVKLNRLGTPLPSEWEEDCCFPLWIKSPKGKPTYNCFGNRLPNISRAAFAFVESIQPYHYTHSRKSRGMISTPKVMGWLAELNNVDKHRHLNVIDPALVHREKLTFATGMMSRARSGIKHGTKIQRIPAQPYPTVDMKTRFTVYVAFKEARVGDNALFSVQELLQFCVKEVECTIIPRFVDFLK